MTRTLTGTPVLRVLDRQPALHHGHRQRRGTQALRELGVVELRFEAALADRDSQYRKQQQARQARPHHSVGGGDADQQHVPPVKSTT
ncbi:hypothetical protein [Prauserella flavalba]|uniref:Uncharacterized protein n=1 Tax=Prauserella flavalba TaxID=1477506 RepID=A0A318LU03_9PSEU|nr:hypothetical protein [Prauserella flavalba]PXY26487.1 hypothetical protein BA062_23970 [Prauserella flavalba]